MKGVPKEPKGDDGLNDRQRRFAHEYAVDFNATKAAERAGYSPRTAYSQGHDLLKKPEIISIVNALKQERLDNIKMSADEVLAEIAHLARFRLGDLMHVTADGDPYIDLTKMDETARAALDEATIEDFVDRRERDEEGNVIARDVRRVKIKASSKLGALNTLARHHKLLVDRVEVTADEDFAALMFAADKRARG